MKKTLLLTTSLLLFLSGFIHSTPAFDHPMTLAELIDVALENHPSTKQAWWNANRAASVLGSANSAYYPNITFDASVRNGRDFKFINGPDTSYTIVGANLYLNMLLLDFGERRANFDMAQSALIAANWQMDWNIQKVMVRVLENAYSTLYAQEVLQASKISLDEAEKVLNAAKELNRTGLTPKTDVYTAQATFFQMKMDYIQQKARLDIQRGHLAASLGLPATACIEIVNPEGTFSCQIEQVDVLIAIALQQRADLMAKRARLQESIFNKIRANASFQPKVFLNSRFGHNVYVQDKSNGAQFEIGLNLEAPLFNGFDTIYQNRIAYADARITNEQLVELQIDIALEVLTHSRNLQAAQEMIPDAEANLNNSLQAYEGVLEKYKAGKESIADLSFAQQQLAAARVRFSDVKTKLFISIANLAYATGTLAPYMETPCQENP